MKFSILKVLSTVACVLVFEDVLGWGEAFLLSQQGQQEDQVFDIREAMNTQDPGERQLALDSLQVQLVYASRSEDTDTINNVSMIYRILIDYWQQQDQAVQAVQQWNNIQRRILELSQLPVEEQNELELLQLKLDGLQITEEYLDLIDVSNSAPEFCAFVLLQVTSEQQTLSVLRSWLRWVQRQYNTWDISFNLNKLAVNSHETNQFLESHQENWEDPEYWRGLMNIKSRQASLEAGAILINDSLKLDHPELTIYAYENFLSQQRQESQFAVE